MYKVTIKPLSNFKSELTSITLFGAICKAIEYYLGSEYIDTIYDGEETLVVTDTYIELKDTLIKNFKPENKIFKQVEIVRKTPDGRKDFQLYNSEDNLFFLVETSFDEDVLRKLLEITFSIGVGSGKSVGYGQFELISIEEINLDELNKGEGAYTILSDYIPNKGDSIIGNFNTRIIRSKTITGDEKQPIYVVNSLSKFKGNPKGNMIGRILKDTNTGALLSGQSLILKEGVR